MNAFRRTAVAVFILGLGAIAARAEGNTTNIVNGTISNISDIYYVGETGSFNALVVTNGGVVNVSYFSYVGFGGNASNNSVIVTGINSKWDAGAFLNVGETGAVNSVSILNGGTLASMGGTMGNATGANQNSVTVSGAGSTWNNNGQQLTVGNNGDHNQLTISTGGQVFNGKGLVGYDGASNTVLVTGTHSLWSNNGDLVVGDHTSGNQMTITSGGQAVVTNGTAYIGYSDTAAINTVSITGSGSLWDNTYGLVVGNNGSGNHLSIADGGIVSNGYGQVGAEAGARNNSVRVDNGGWINRQSLSVGANGNGNSLTITNGGHVFSGTGAFVGSGGSSSNTVWVTGAGSVWTNTGSLTIGSDSGASFNQLAVLNGARMYNAGLNIGYGGDTPASNNSVLVDGDGSTWIDSGNLYVGRAGTDNRMTISAGGFVSNQMARIGSSSASANNAVTVDGHGSTWSIAGTLSVGYSGSSNSLAISNGGLVLASNILIGARSGSDGNHVAITDGHLVATNSAGAGFVDVCRGRLSLNRGTITANAFIATNGASSVVQFDGGSLHTGGTTVSNGALFVVGDGTESATLDFIGGTHCFSDGLSISSNAQLTGTGTLLAPLTLAGTLSPGHSPGQIIVSNDVTLVGGSTLYVEMAGYTAGDGYDQLVVSGLLTNNAASLSVMLLDGFSPTNGAQFVIIDNAADGYGAFLGASEGRILDFGSGTSFSITYSGGSDHHDVVLMAVPEPSSLLLAAGSVVVGLWMTARRRRASRRE